MNNFCDDTFAIVEERVKKQRKKSKEFSDSFKNSPRSAAETPREVVLNAVSSFCEDVIAVAEGEAIKVLSPRPLAGPSEKKEKALPQANPSPRRTKKSESQSDKPKKGEKRAADSSPKQSNAQPTPSQSDSEFSSDAVLKGQKVSRIPPPKKVKPKVTAPSRAEMESDVPHPTDPLNGNPQTDSSKNNKDIGKRPVRDKKKSGKPKGLSPSPSAGDGLFPPINRPSPPSGERNQNQNENPRRKMSRYSSKEDKKENANTHLPDVTPSHQRNPRDKPSKSVPNNRILDTNEDGLLINREQSKSAQISDDRTTLPPIKGLPRSETTPRHKKRRKPLFLRLEDKARKLQMEIEREKVRFSPTATFPLLLTSCLDGNVPQN